MEHEPRQAGRRRRHPPRDARCRPRRGARWGRGGRPPAHRRARPPAPAPRRGRRRPAPRRPGPRPRVPGAPRPGRPPRGPRSADATARPVLPEAPTTRTGPSSSSALTASAPVVRTAGRSDVVDLGRGGAAREGGVAGAAVEERLDLGPAAAQLARAGRRTPRRRRPARPWCRWRRRRSRRGPPRTTPCPSAGRARPRRRAARAGRPSRRRRWCGCGSTWPARTGSASARASTVRSSGPPRSMVTSNGRPALPPLTPQQARIERSAIDMKCASRSIRICFS